MLVSLPALAMGLGAIYVGLWEMFPQKYFLKRWILERFGVYFNIIWPLKCSLLTYEW